jgi:hypothetical protein
VTWMYTYLLICHIIVALPEGKQNLGVENSIKLSFGTEHQAPCKIQYVVKTLVFALLISSMRCVKFFCHIFHV